jgi:hypothetical protein
VKTKHSACSLSSGTLRHAQLLSDLIVRHCNPIEQFLYFPRREYDPITPPSNGNLAAQTLSQSQALRFPGTGHGVGFGAACPKSIVLAFEENPTQQPDTGSIASISEPAFT